MNSLTTRQTWLNTAIVLLAGVACSVSIYKVPATISQLMQYFEIGATEGGLLVSLVSVVGIFLMIPAGGLMQKVGARRLMMLAFVANILGNLLGLFSESILLLMISRFVEGIGVGLITVLAPTLISSWFAPQKLGVPMALWSLWVSVGLLFVLNIAAVFVNPVNPESWRGVWILTIAVFAVLAVLFGFCVRLSPVESALPDAPGASTKAGAETASNSNSNSDSAYQGLKSIPAWCLCVVGVVFSICQVSLATFVPVYCQTALGFGFQEANAITSFATVGMIIGGLVMGFVLNKVKNRSLVLLVLMSVGTVFIFFFFQFSASIAMPFMLACGFVMSMIVATIFTLVPQAAPSLASAGIVMGIVTTGQSVGGVLGPTATGAVLDASGFVGVTWFLLVIAILGIIFAVGNLIFIRRKQLAENRKP